MNENDDILRLKSVMVIFQAENDRRCVRLVGNCLKTPIWRDFRLNSCLKDRKSQSNWMEE